MSATTAQVFRTQCHPEAQGRKPQCGDREWKLRFTLENGTELFILMGKEGHDTFRGFLLREELEDAADEAQGLRT